MRSRLIGKFLTVTVAAAVSVGRHSVFFQPGSAAGTRPRGCPQPAAHRRRGGGAQGGGGRGGGGKRRRSRADSSTA